MKKVIYIGSVLVVCMLGWYLLSSRDGEQTSGQTAAMITLDSGKQVASFQEYMKLHSTDAATVNAALRNIENGWHPGSAVMLIEMTQAVKYFESRKSIFDTLAKQTGQSFGDDGDRWFQWIWNNRHDPHPQYGEFKAELYGQVDPHFESYFKHTDNAKIRLDEIRWGGVLRDGIPPLKNPEMIPANRADYLEKSNVVFGVVINGEARCYPKRILAWHEMFKDTIGGESVCGVY